MEKWYIKDVNRQKGLAPILIIILIAVVIVGGYLIYQRQTKPAVVPQVIQPSSTPVSTSSATNPAETANWKKYTNKEQGFSIQYPQSMTVILEGWNVPNKKWSISWSNKSKEETAKTGSNYSITIQTENNAINSKGQKIIPENMDTLYANDLKAEEVQFSNKPARKLQASTYPNGGSLVYYILDGDRLISLTGTSDDLNKFSLPSIDQILSTFKFLDQNATDETTNWKTFSTTGINSGLTLKYPQDWVTVDNTFISEKTFIPGEQDRTKIYNTISMNKYASQISKDYTNSEWFNKIASLNDSLTDQKEKRTKVSSGTIMSGESFVIFYDESSSVAIGDAFKQVKAYILKGETIYQLTLDLYDDNGMETFKKIVKSAAVK